MLRQRRPGQWLVAAESDPARDTVLTEHGCILIVPVHDMSQAGHAKAKAKARGPTGKRFRQEAQATHAILEKDLCAMREDLKKQATILGA